MPEITTIRYLSMEISEFQDMLRAVIPNLIGAACIAGISAVYRRLRGDSRAAIQRFCVFGTLGLVPAIPFFALVRDGMGEPELLGTASYSMAIGVAACPRASLAFSFLAGCGLRNLGRLYSPRQSLCYREQWQPLLGLYYALLSGCGRLGGWVPLLQCRYTQLLPVGFRESL